MDAVAIRCVQLFVGVSGLYDLLTHKRGGNLVSRVGGILDGEMCTPDVLRDGQTYSKLSTTTKAARVEGFVC